MTGSGTTNGDRGGCPRPRGRRRPGLRSTAMKKLLLVAVLVVLGVIAVKKIQATTA
jgi:hypothetical protein